MKNKTVLLIDTSAIIYRSYHALPPLSTAGGEMVNAVYGVASTILSVYKELAPDYMIAAYDTSAPTFRHKAYDGYKATRKETPADLKSQFGYVRELMDAFGIVGIEKEGFEADDVIGTLTARITAEYPDVDVVIVTGDNDALQLVTDRVRVRTFGRGLSDAKIYDVDAVKEKFDLAPGQLADYKGLAGDSSDNIPGVTGVGAKTASKLLIEYSDLDGVYAHIEEQKGALKTKLERDRAQAFLSRDLGRIATDVEIAYDMDAAHADLHTSEIKDFFKKMNFFSLIKRLPEAQGDGAAESSVDGEAEVKDEKYVTVAPEDAADVLSALKREEVVAVSAAHEGEVLTGFAFSTRAGRAQFVLWLPETQDAIKKFFGDTERGACVVTYDLKALMHMCRTHEIDVVAPYNDVLLQAYVLGAGTALSLEKSAMEVLGEELGEVATQLTLVPDLDAIARSTQRRADVMLRLALHYRERIAQVADTQGTDANIQTVLEEMEVPLVPVLAAMEARGIGCDADQLGILSGELGAHIAELEAKIHEYAGAQFNVNSTQQLAQVLFDTLALPTDFIKKTKTGYSTAASELEKIHDAHPIVPAIEEYRELYKLKSTYVDALPKMIAEDGRIHTNFQQAVTATGRLSSSDPNLQNIPTRTEQAQRIRKAFVAREGYMLISADYSQIDLRCVAHISGDEKMIAAFKRGDDIHETTAMEVFGVTKSKVTKTMRRHAKALNFGLIYGMGAYGFARSAGIEMDDARAFIAKYFKRFAGVDAYMTQTIAQAKEDGFVQTPFGRRRNVPEIHSPNQQLARSGERMAINMPVQGMAADIMKKAMIAVENDVLARYGEDAVMVLQVHDEVICEVKASLVDEVSPLLVQAMQDVAQLAVPLVVEAVSGQTWSDLK